MTINSIKSFGGYETHKLEHLEQQRQEVQKAAMTETGSDRISISEEAQIKAGMLKAAQNGDGVRADLVADLKARIESGEYSPDGRDIARNMVRQELDIWG
jgi:negative regulator of flagellin synthesis FlgM